MYKIRKILNKKKEIYKMMILNLNILFYPDIPLYLNNNSFLEKTVNHNTFHTLNPNNNKMIIIKIKKNWTLFHLSMDNFLHSN